MNDKERAQWLDNDEGLYDMWKATRIPKQSFVRSHRKMIDRAVNQIIHGRKQAHYLKYDLRNPFGG